MNEDDDLHEEIEQSSCVSNPYYSVFSADYKCDASNRISRILFSGKFDSSVLPVGCDRPQRLDGSLIPEVRTFVQNLFGGSNEINSLSLRPQLTMLSPGYLSSPRLCAKKSRGYILPNGNTWVRHKSVENLTQSQLNSLPVRKHYGNQSLVIVGGRRIDPGTSNECIRFAQNKECLANALCAFDHDGCSLHRLQKLCSSQMRGLCRNAKDCENGAHLLESHQLPICDFFLRMMCNERECPYLHIKHYALLDNCHLFQKGVCTAGVNCSKPHCYNSSVIEQKSGNENVFPCGNDGFEMANDAFPVLWHCDIGCITVDPVN